MQKFVSKYATAVHLALLAVAPIVLVPFLAPTKISVVTLWLALIATAWVFLEPSRLRFEMPHDARIRVAWSTLRDPFFWFFVVVSLFTGIRAVNDGIALVYNAESMTWTLSSSIVPFLPGSVPGVGFFLFVASVSTCTLLVGARHALGRSARLAFFVATTFFSGVAAVMSVLLLSYGSTVLEGFSRCRGLTPFSIGAVYGISLLGGIVALFGCVEMKWRHAEPLTVICLVFTAIAFLVFSSSETIFVFTILFLFLIILSFVLQGSVFDGSGSFRLALEILCVFLVAGMFVIWAAPDTAVGEKRSSFLALSIFPEKFFEMREVLSRIAFSAWKDHPWLGTGLGSFPFEIRFAATTSDWTVIDPLRQVLPNGWWLLVCERGVVGVSLYIVGFGFLLWSYFSRMISALESYRWHPMNCLFLLLVAGFVALTFIDHSVMCPDVLPILVVFLVLSSVAFPVRHTTESEK